MIGISKVLDVKPFSICVAFDNGETRWVLLENRLRNWSSTPDSKFKALLDPQFFASVRFNPELETIEWANGIDFCPDQLYEWSLENKS